MDKLSTLRTIHIGRFLIEIAEYIEEVHPADMICYGNDPEGKRAEKEYLRKVETGEIPWYCLGVHVYITHDVDGGAFIPEVEIGSAYLGCVDTYDLHAVGVRWVVKDAIEEARATLDRLAKITS